MSIDEQESVRNTAYYEAVRYLANAQETYRLAGKDGRYYLDKKYVKGGANYAYHAVLIALDAWLQIKNVPTPKRKSIDWYRKEVGRLDKKLLARLNAAYDTLHLAGGYDGNLLVDVNKAGLKTAQEVIDVLKP